MLTTHFRGLVPNDVSRGTMIRSVLSPSNVEEKLLYSSLADKAIKTDVITVSHMFKKVEQSMSIIRRPER